MPSEHLHIDHFFRSKENELTINPAAVEISWNQMQSLIHLADQSASKPGRVRSMKKYLSYAATTVLAVSISAVLISRKTSPVAKKVSAVNNTSSISWATFPNPSNKSIKQNVIPNKTSQASISNKPVSNRALQSVTVKHDPFTPANQGSLHPTEIQVATKWEDSHSDENKPDAATLYANFYQDLRKPFQEFKLSGTKDTTIKCAEGTTIFVPAGSFQTVTGMAITGIVRLHVQEFYSFADIIGNKLTTLSGNELLESGGMLNIKASTEDNAELMIRPGSALDLKMPTSGFNPEMQLFTGVETKETTVAPNTVVNRNATGINWLAVGQQQYFLNDRLKYIKIIDYRDEPAYVRYGTKKTVAIFKLAFEAAMTNEEAKRELDKRYGYRYDQIKVKRSWKALWKKNRGLGTTDWYNLYNNVNITGDSIMIPLYLACKQKLINREDSIAYEAEFKEKLELAKKQKRSYEEYLKRMEAYNFRITNLGWINCDRFLNYPNSRVTDLYASTSIEVDSRFTQAMLFFEKENAFISGYMVNGKMKFGRIPVGHWVYLVCTTVKDGKVMSSLQRCRVEKDKLPIVSFEETSPEKFRAQLAVFGNVK